MVLCTSESIAPGKASKIEEKMLNAKEQNNIRIVVSSCLENKKKGEFCLRSVESESSESGSLRPHLPIIGKLCWFERLPHQALRVDTYMNVVYTSRRGETNETDAQLRH